MTLLSLKRTHTSKSPGLKYVLCAARQGAAGISPSSREGKPPCDLAARALVLGLTCSFFARGDVSPKKALLLNTYFLKTCALCWLPRPQPLNSAGVGGNDLALPKRSNPVKCCRRDRHQSQPPDPISGFKVTLSEFFCFGLFHVRLCAASHLNKWFCKFHSVPAALAKRRRPSETPFNARCSRCLEHACPDFSVGFSPSRPSVCSWSVTFLGRLFLIMPELHISSFMSFRFSCSGCLPQSCKDLIYFFASLFTVHLPQ